MPIENNAPDNPLLSRLNELKGETDPDFVMELIEIFISETPKQIQAISKAIISNDLTGLTLAAHKLKGSSLNLGAKHMGALCLKLEELGRSGKPVTADTSTREIESEFECVKSIMLKFKQNIG